jgi:hypothetical protein
MFKNCYSLVKLNTPNKITKIGNNAFTNCKALSSLDLSQAKVIGDSAFFSAGLTSVTLADGLAKISSGCFQYCSKLESVKIPETVSVIDQDAFEGCSSLKSIRLPSSITTLEEGAFASCTALENVDFGEAQLQKIKTETFKDCTALKVITIPSSIQIIEESAFENCLNLSQVKLEDISRESLNRIEEDAFYNCQALNYFYIPYKSTTMEDDCIGYISVNDSSYEKNKDLTIYGLAGSTIEEYCIANEINFIPITVTDEVIDGDANMDGKLTTMDILAVKKYILGVSQEDFSNMHADMNKDGYVNVIDLIMLKAKVIEK